MSDEAFATIGKIVVYVLLGFVFFAPAALLISFIGDVITGRYHRTRIPFR